MSESFYAEFNERLHDVTATPLRIAVHHSVTCLLLGLFSLGFIDNLIPEPIFHLLGIAKLGSVAAMAAANGVLVGLGTWMIHWWLSQRFHKAQQAALISDSLNLSWSPQTPPLTGKQRLWVTALGFAAGVLVTCAVAWHRVAYGLAILVLVLVGINVRDFLRRVTRLVAPNAQTGWGDIKALANIYLTMLTAFTYVNASLGFLHMLKASGGDLVVSAESPATLTDAFYFSVVVMTTLGFGDIVPSTPSARVVVALECLSSYVLFALLVGIVTRGITSRTTPPPQDTP